MKASELRIGNLISRKDLGNGEDRIETIIELGRKAITSGPIKVICEYFELSPIPLTEEWLLKFGFEKDYDGCLALLIGKSRFQWSNGILLWQQTSYNDWSEFPCGHVHQLQNLYFALTGTELEIK